jgi:hypothetical protein
MATWINHGECIIPINVSVVEKAYNAKFVGELPIRNKGSWTDFPVQIYYQETPPNKDYSNYFALLINNGRPLITSGSSVFGIPIFGLRLPSGEIIYSRSRHDFRSADTADVWIDGGFSYCRCGGGDIASARQVTLTIKGSEIVLVEDPDEIKLLQSNLTKLIIDESTS